MDGETRIRQPAGHPLSRLFWIIVFPLFLLGIVYPPRLSGYLNPYDEGLWLGAAQALLSGKQLYRDVFFHYGPLLGLAWRGAVRFLPHTLSALRAASWAMNAAGLLCIYACLLRWVRAPSLRIAYAVFFSIIPLSAHVPTIPMAARYGAGFLPFLCWPLADSDPAQARWRSALSGLLAVAALLISQEVGAAALVAGAYYFCFGSQAPRRGWWFAAGISAGVLAALVWLGAAGVLKAYVDCAFLQTGRIVSGDRLPLPSAWPGSWPSWADMAALYGPASAYACAALLLIGRVRAGVRSERAIAALILYGALTAASAWNRADHWHIYFALSPALFLWALLADRAAPKVKDAAILAAVIAGAFLVLPHAAARQAKDRRLLLSGRLLNLGRAGSSHVPDRQAAGYEYLVHWIERHTHAGESVLFYPYDGVIYFLADRPSPSFYPVLILAASPVLQERAVRDIIEANPAWVIWDKENIGFDGVPIEKRLPSIQRLIETRYRVHEKAGPFVFLKRVAP